MPPCLSKNFLYSVANKSKNVFPLSTINDKYANIAQETIMYGERGQRFRVSIKFSDGDYLAPVYHFNKIICIEKLYHMEMDGNFELYNMNMHMIDDFIDDFINGLVKWKYIDFYIYINYQHFHSSIILKLLSTLKCKNIKIITDQQVPTSHLHIFNNTEGVIINKESKYPNAEFASIVPYTLVISLQNMPKLHTLFVISPQKTFRLNRTLNRLNPKSPGNKLKKGNLQTIYIISATIMGFSSYNGLYRVYLEKNHINKDPNYIGDKPDKFRNITHLTIKNCTLHGMCSLDYILEKNGIFENIEHLSLDVNFHFRFEDFTKMLIILQDCNINNLYLNGNTYSNYKFEIDDFYKKHKKYMSIYNIT